MRKKYQRLGYLDKIGEQNKIAALLGKIKLFSMENNENNKTITID